MKPITKNVTKVTNNTSEFKKLLADEDFIEIPKVGEIVKGKVISVAKNEIRIDIEGLTTGVIRGRELYDESEEYAHLKVGDEKEATVLELENENGEMELSFRYAGQKKTWQRLRDLKEKQEIVSVKVIEANKGGLMVQLGPTAGFLPVSQLTPEHYPRVPGGDKSKILERLRSFIGQELSVKIIDIDEVEEKLIVSEKIAWEARQKNVIAKLKVGDVVEGKVTAITDFGAFVEFGDGLEGLVHISEIAWQRIDHPKDLIKIGDRVGAKITSIDGSKIFLSIKATLDDPWKHVQEKYKIGQVVEGKILKINPFGFFVELDQDIHGLAHISELSENKVEDPRQIAKVGDVLQFKVVSLSPEDHRLGLSIRALGEKSPKEDLDAEDKAKVKDEKVLNKDEVVKEAKE